jgi:hypothetical protein
VSREWCERLRWFGKEFVLALILTKPTLKQLIELDASFKSRLKTPYIFSFEADSPQIHSLQCYGGPMTDVLSRSISLFKALDNFHQDYCLIGALIPRRRLELVSSLDPDPVSE